MEITKTKGKMWGVSPWLLMGAMVVLVSIFAFMTLDNIEKQKEQTLKIFVEKGDTLIRSFEAGVRTGMRDGKADFFHLQKLVMETAQQPDIDFITVTNQVGLIIADSDPSLLGEYYGEGLDLEAISRSRRIAWRLVSNPDGIDTFEVFRQFAPSERPSERYGEKALAKRSNDKVNEVIFIGLNTGPIEAARKAARRNTVLLALLLLFIGISGILSLFFAQAYRAAHTSLSRIRAFSDSIVENMPIGLVAVDKEGSIISFNQTAESTLRQASPEVIGKPGTEILPVPLQQIIAETEGEKAIIEREIDCPVEPGQATPLEVIATALRDDSGATLGRIILFRDLTEVRHLKREVARSQRLAALGNLAAGVAHEIRNPLSSIKGFATYFKERYRNNPADGETADIMIQEVERLNRVITQLLDLARPVDMEKKPHSLQEVLANSLKMIEPQARKANIAIQAEVAPDIPEVVIDADKMKQVLLNLYLNALEAMKDGGSLIVQLSRAEAGKVRIIISDSGVGIDEKNIAHIFDPFFTTRPSGTGLGLSIVHKIIEAHDGEISVKSAPSEGTRVTVLLPIT